MFGRLNFASCSRLLSFTFLSICLISFFTGCAREPDVKFTAREIFSRGSGKDAQIYQLSPEMRDIVANEVNSLLGDGPKSLAMLGAAPLSQKLFEEPEDYDEFEELRRNYLLRSWSGNFDSDHLAEGRAIYTQRCVQCHGITGDGAGEMAEYLYPRPRDYRKGVFKFISTTLKPLRRDLIRTVVNGVTGTSMPSFDRLKKREVEAVVDYVLALTHRGELEYELTVLLVNDLDLPDKPDADASAEDLKEYEEDLADFQEELAEEKLAVIENILTSWTFDKDDDELLLKPVEPLTPQPRFTPKRIEAGRLLFAKVGCMGCHDIDGRGLSKGFDKFDEWNMPTIAADLTSGMLHGGRDPVDIYRRFYVGIKGTPMPSVMQSKDIQQALKDDPNAVWNLVAYVLSLSEHRRNGVTPAAGPLEIRTFQQALSSSKQQNDSKASDDDS